MDREKVIKGLEHCAKDGGKEKEYPCRGCPYEEILEDCHIALKADALALLKEQGERVKPRLSREWYICDCGASITVEVDGEPLHKAKYCAECGRGIEWE